MKVFALALLLVCGVAQAQGFQETDAAMAVESFVMSYEPDLYPVPSISQVAWLEAAQK